MKQTKSLVLLAVACGWMLLAGLAPLDADARAGRKAKIEGKININTASPEQLTLLPRIGLKKAMMIIERRKKTPFRQIQEITKVKGIGMKTFLKLKPYLSIEGPTTAKPVASSKE